MFMMKNSFMLAADEVLSDEQTEIVTQAVHFVETNLQQDQKRIFVIEGGAGAGKSVVLLDIFKQIQEKNMQQNQQSSHYLLVNHAEMLKIYRDYAGSQPLFKKNQFLKPTSFINQMDKREAVADVVLIDEAHLLLTSPDRYNKFKQDNQLVEIIKHARVIVMVFDPKQVLKFKSMWDNQLLMRIIASYHPVIEHLTKQYRMTGQSEAVVKWINQLTQDRQVAQLTAVKDFDFRVYDDATAMYQAIQERNQQLGMSRILATTDYKYTVNRGTWYVTLDNFQLPWDQLDTGTTPWAMRPDTINEVGSVYTIQGFDLNYAGVIIGPSIQFDEQLQQLVIDPHLYEDKAAFRQLKGQSFNRQAKEELMLHALEVLLKRGRYGLYLCIADRKLRRHVLKQVSSELCFSDNI